jgi:hypothetical protein
LKNKGVASDTIIDGKRCWSLTGNNYDEKPNVRMVISFPHDVHDRITNESAKIGVSKTKFIIESVKKNLNR